MTEGELGKRLCSYRKLAGMTQAEAAKSIGIVDTSLNKIESGNRRVTALELIDMAKLYGVPIAAIVGEEIMQPVMQESGVRRFYLERLIDPVGISGTGIIAEGAVFSSGKAVLQWLTEYRSLGIYDSISDILSIHGHNGMTSLIWSDE